MAFILKDANSIGEHIISTLTVSNGVKHGGIIPSISYNMYVKD